MRDNIEDQKGLERLGRNIVILCVIGVAASAVVVCWALYALWKGLA